MDFWCYVKVKNITFKNVDITYKNTKKCITIIKC